MNVRLLLERPSSDVPWDPNLQSVLSDEGKLHLMLISGTESLK